MAAQIAGWIHSMGRSSLLVLESVSISILVSSLLGFLAGVGVGGGSLLILWLTLVLQMPYQEARIVNLLFFLPAAVIASIFRWRQGKLDLKKILPAIVVGCIAAGICALFSQTMDTEKMRKSFGILLLITGVRELLYKPKQKKTGRAAQ